jgi:hypothetical protein
MMPQYSEDVRTNVEFLGERAREMTADEVDRTKSLDTKATALIAGCVALIAAGASFASRMGELPGGSGAKTAWAIEIAGALGFLLAAAGFAVWAIVPKAVRTAVAYHEVETWALPSTLQQDCTLVAGTLLRAATHSVGHARGVNNRKADRMMRSSWLFAAAIAFIVALTVHLSIYAAIYAT